MTLDQKGKKQMLAYNLDFSLLVRYEYHRRHTRIVGGEFLHDSQSQGDNLKLWQAIYGLTPETVWNRARKNFALTRAVLWLISFRETENNAENVRENKHCLHLNIFT